MGTKRALLWPGDRHVIDGLDGVRAIAALGVVAFHVHKAMEPAEPDWLAGLAAHGWIGVDLFFALSGFLITGILLRTRGRSGYFASFYKRRVLRIFPLYFGVVAMACLRRRARDMPELIPEWSAVLFQTNWFAAHGTDEPLLTGTWSLSIEEQFYAVWPLLLVIAPPHRLRWVLAGMVLFAPLYRAWIHDPGHLASYMYTPGRVDALGFGAMAALAWFERRETVARAAGRLTWPALALFAALVASGVFEQRGDLLTAVLGYSLFPMLTATVLLGLASGQAPRLARALEWRPLRAVGRCSYGVYLLHPMVLRQAALAGMALGIPVTTEPLAGVLAYPFGILASVAIAMLVFESIEKPILALKDRWAPYGPPERGS